MDSLRLKLAVLSLGAFCAASAFAQTYGNTVPFEGISGHSSDFVLGVQVNIATDMTLQSFGMMYGNGGDPDDANAIFGLYSSDPGNFGLPMSLVAVTNTINLTTEQTYDNIAFTSTPTVTAGTYWMMALYESNANPRMGTLDSGSLVAYWSNPFGDGMPGTASGINTYTGQNFNYWVNGTASVPEPASLLVLAVGALALRRSRKRS